MSTPPLRLATRLARTVLSSFDRFAELGLANMEHSGLWWKHHPEPQPSRPEH